MGGKGDDILIGGEGEDTYYYSYGDGNDKIIDTGLNRIIVEDSNGQVHAIENVYKTGADVYTAADGKVILNHHSPWQLSLEGGGTITLGEQFQSGDFGINLLDVPDAPQTTNNITGDLTPTNIINPQYNSLETNRGHPMPSLSTRK